MMKRKNRLVNSFVTLMHGVTVGFLASLVVKQTPNMLLVLLLVLEVVAYVLSIIYIKDDDDCEDTDDCQEEDNEIN